MRIIVMYDISFEDEIAVKQYTQFRNNLLKLGYFMMQYSIYVKCIPNHLSYEYEKKKIINYLPSNANIRIFMITESQYQNIELLTGKKSLNEIYNGTERYIKL
ncbi:CRISPR-associated endonuclease Cas2 [Mycoplasma zalophidermidis]|uniref:CRISPR-associated endonuclease Cas2 n=1 Tax=Mycoplasma zalophidermidis TaxID=398174 RepID=UPI001C0FB155|nr:CRISPR-associated endonuclease Cas2 [Mycoplasma zalophidermidis]MBU4689959.1 CRISPR-associated endonuclease Cas2 [Mycoplasma zalophidermidis]MCR8966875.1 CRISPR-associated endonuclease Cas2 [Mycoplasma zalophidermidis]